MHLEIKNKILLKIDYALNWVTFAVAQWNQKDLLDFDENIQQWLIVILSKTSNKEIY